MFDSRNNYVVTCRQGGKEVLKYRIDMLYGQLAKFMILMEGVKRSDLEIWKRATQLHWRMEDWSSKNM